MKFARSLAAQQKANAALIPQQEGPAPELPASEEHEVVVTKETSTYMPKIPIRRAKIPIVKKEPKSPTPKINTVKKETKTPTPKIPVRSERSNASQPPTSEPEEFGDFSIVSKDA